MDFGGKIQKYLLCCHWRHRGARHGGRVTEVVVCHFALSSAKGKVVAGSTAGGMRTISAGYHDRSGGTGRADAALLLLPGTPSQASFLF